MNHMAKHHFRFTLVLISLALVSLVSCIVAEYKRTKTKDIKLDGNLCYLPPSHSFGFGIAALTCLLLAQTIAILQVLCTKMKKKNTKRPNHITFTTLVLLLISWSSFGSAVILLGAATSMNREQEYGKGWLDGECYVVKQGVYIASAIIILLSIASILGSTITKGQIGLEQTQNLT